MRWSYKVIRFTDFIKVPSDWRFWKRSEQIAVSMENAINRMANDGWEFIDSYAMFGAEPYFVFRRPMAGNQDKHMETGIKEADFER